MRTVRVLQSFGPPRPTTNPYITMLDEALAATPGLEHVRFSWREALTGRYDAIHLHWPETLLGGRTRWRSAAKRAAFAALLVRLAVRRTAVVRTVHNLELPDAGRVDRFLLGRVEALATLRVTISAATRLPAGVPTETVLHGHYRDWYGRYPASEPVAGRLAFVGLIRRYKGVEQLLDAFARTDGALPGLTLTVSGRPSSAALADEVRAAQARDPRIAAHLDFLPDAELVAAVTSAELVVLPYRFMHNSGTVLAALSLGRPVLVPRNAANDLLAAEVGPGWVHTYDGDLTADDLVAALTALRRDPPPAAPDLGAREWDDAGRRHLAAYRRAVDLAHGRGAVGSPAPATAPATAVGA